MKSVQLCRYLNLKEHNFNNIPEEANEQDNPLGI